jgi:hypothetical protein
MQPTKFHMAINTKSPGIAVARIAWRPAETIPQLLCIHAEITALP